MKGQEDFFEKLGMPPDGNVTVEITTEESSPAKPTIPESKVRKLIKNSISTPPKHRETWVERLAREKEETEENFIRMRDSRIDIYK